jgi:rhodanese-related sulfurtransferase
MYTNKLNPQTTIHRKNSRRASAGTIFNTSRAEYAAGFIIYYILPVLIALILFSPSFAGAEVINVTAKKAAGLIETQKNNSEFVILDIRTPAEYQAGHIAHAVLIDYYSKNFSYNINQLDKSKTYIVYCRSGNRTGKSLDLFRKLNFNRVYNLKSGINEWLALGLPLTQN